MPNKNRAVPVADRVAAVVDLLGAERFCDLLDILAERLRLVLIRLGDEHDTALPIELVHQSQGSAGSLGLIQVANALGRLEHVMKMTNDRKNICTNSASNKRMIDDLASILDKIQIQRSRIAHLNEKC